MTCQSVCGYWSLEIGDTILGTMRWQTAPQCGQVGYCVGHYLLLKLQVWSESSNQTIASTALARRLWDLCSSMSCKTMTHPSQVVFNWVRGGSHGTKIGELSVVKTKLG